MNHNSINSTMKQVKLKLCGLYLPEDILMVNEFLPDYVGFVINVAKSHRNVSLEQVLQWHTILSPDIKRVGVFVNEALENIVSVSTGLDVVQLHGEETVEELARLRESLPQMEFWKAFSVKTTADVEKALAFPSDKVLLDYGKGDGKSFDWRILDGITKPYILAGGINPHNVKAAVENTTAEIIDISSGIETNRKKDPELVKQLYKEMMR